MSDDVDILTPREELDVPVPLAPSGTDGGPPRRGGTTSGRDGDGNGAPPAAPAAPPPPARPRLRKLRLALILTGLILLALISTVFGMMMAVASDLPQLENRAQYKKAANSYLYDDHWRPIGIFAPPNNVVIDNFNQVSPWMRRAMVAVEDKRFWSDPGVDIRGIARAFVTDITGGSTQGASTIAQQFVKNALSEQNNRTVFEKLREAALAYHLTREWPKWKILQEYLNSIYFGNGAYGIESAARVYFGKLHGYSPAAAAGEAQTATTTTGVSTTGTTCGDGSLPRCASLLTSAESALLAGMVASPGAFDPIAHPQASKARRDRVLKDMLAQHYITRAEYEQDTAQPLPTASQIQQPAEPTVAPYFTSWLRPQILAALGLGRGTPGSVAEYRAYYGGLKIRTSLDLEMERAAEQAINAELPPGSGLPTASLVAIDNRTGEVRAMVGGQDFSKAPFNLATEGHRQPGSSFKPFTLAAALESGKYGPDSVIDSAPQDFIVPNSAGKEHFIVHNFGNTYSGPITLADATAISDNSVFSQVGINVGTARIARLAKRMGIRSPVSNNYAMILGGLREGVTPLDMAHAYETFATGGLRVFNPKLGAPHEGPTGISQINCPPHVCGSSGKTIIDTPAYKRIIPASIAATVHYLLEGVVTSGTGKAAAISGVIVAGKTGTTTNYGDAWFVGWTPQMTTAVWVGYPTSLKSMATDFNGAPVEGGTYPAIIWQAFMTQALQILASEKTSSGNQNGSTTTTGSSTPSGSGPGSSGSVSSSSGAGGTGSGAGSAAGAGTAQGAGATGGTAGGGTAGGGGGGTAGAGTGGTGGTGGGGGSAGAGGGGGGSAGGTGGTGGGGGGGATGGGGGSGGGASGGSGGAGLGGGH
jgi:penicillin-binding protein 1A